MPSAIDSTLGGDLTTTGQAVSKTRLQTALSAAASEITQLQVDVAAVGSPAASDVVFTPAGDIAATDVQAAIEELDSEKQPIDADLTAIAALAKTDGNVIVGDGTNWVAESGATARTSLGAAASGANSDITSLAGLTTALSVAQGGTGAATAGDARTALGLAIGTNVQAYDADLAAIAGLTSAADKGIQFTGSGTAGTYDLTAAGKAILDDADAAAQLVTLTALGQGIHSVFIPASAMRPTVSNGCATLAAVETTAGRPDMQVLDFDTSADEHAQFQVAMPKSWDEGTVTFRVHHTTTATDTDGVAWGLQGVACSDGDTIDVAYGTPVVVTDAYQSTAEDLYVTATSSAVTIAGTPAAGDMCFFRVFRDVSDAADTAAEDARLIGVEMFFTINAVNDA